MNAPAKSPDIVAPAGWSAALALDYAVRNGRTAMVARRHHGPLTVQRPFYPEAEGVCHTYPLHPPAGVVGGDRLSTTLELAEQAHVLLTTPGATRWYRSGGATAEWTQQCRLAPGATLEWLPQESLVFDGARARLLTRVELAPGAKFFGWELLCLGRPANDERFMQGSLDQRLEIYRAGEPRLLDRLTCRNGLPPGMRGHAATAILVASNAGNAALECARALCACAVGALCAATMFDEFLVCRGLAAGIEPLLETWRALWSALRPLVLGRAAIPPRIWRT